MIFTTKMKFITFFKVKVILRMLGKSEAKEKIKKVPTFSTP